MNSKNKSKARTGTIGFNKQGSKMTVIKYINCTDILVIFDKGKPIHTTWKNFKKGEVRNVYDRTVQGIGYIGEGLYKTSMNGKDTPQYTCWTGILKRCYDEKLHEKQPTYKECSVSEEWHCFQNFATWYDQNYYEFNGEVMCLDKDILIKNNKVYSSKTCVFVPEFINNLFVKSNATRGRFPIGVTYLKNKNIPYQVRCRNNECKNVTIGYFKNEVDAFNAYKTFKEQTIKKVAEDNKDKIPLNLYNAMINYQVEITD